MEAREKKEMFTKDFNFMIKLASLNSLGFFYLGFLIPIIARTIMGASGLQIGLIVSSMVIGFMCSSTFVGYLTDRVKSKRFLVSIGSYGRGVAYFVLYFSIIFNSLSTLWFGWFSLGLGAGFFWIPFDTLVAEKSHKDHRSQAYGKRDAFNAIGQIIGALFGFGIIIIFGLITDSPIILYSAMPIMGVMNLLAGILFVRKVDETSKIILSNDNQDNADKENNYSKERIFPKAMIIGLTLLFILVILSAINNFLWRPFINIYIIEYLTDNLNIVILIYLPVGLLATLLAPKLGQVMDKINPAVGIIITSSIGALLTWLLISTTNIIIFAIIILFDQMIAMAAGLLFRNLLSRINIEHRGKIMGGTNFFTNVGALIGPVLGGYLWDNLGATSPFILSIFVELSLIPLYLITIRFLIPYLAESYEKVEGIEEIF